MQNNLKRNNPNGGVGGGQNNFTEIVLFFLKGAFKWFTAQETTSVFYFCTLIETAP